MTYSQDTLLHLTTLDRVARRNLTQDATWDAVLVALHVAETKKRGKGLIGLCVFHVEKTPSLRFHPLQSFHCYGCGEAGDMIDFVQRIKNFTYLSELQWFFEHLPSLPGSGQLSLF